MITELLLKKGMIFPSLNIFRSQIKSIVASVRNVVPFEEWGCKKADANAVIEERIFIVLMEVSDVYLKAVFLNGWLEISRDAPKAGEYEILFFFVSQLAKNGYLGTADEAKKFLLDGVETHYNKAIHAKNVEALFL